MLFRPTYYLSLTLALIICQTAQAAEKPHFDYETANEMFAQGQVDQAKSIIDNLLSQTGQSKLLLEREHILLGKIYLQKSQIQQALTEFKEAVKSNPQSIDARYMLALNYFDLGDFANAEIYFKQLNHKKNDNFEYIYNLGVTQGKLGHIQDALETLTKASKMPNHKGEPQFAMGEILQLEKKYDEALLKYQECLSINPKFAEVYNNMGVIYSAKSDFSSAVKSFQKALELKPNYNPARKNLGYAEAHTAMAVSLMTQEKTQEAQRELIKALEIDPQFADAHYNLGLLLHRQNQVAQAILEYQTAIQFDPKHARAHNNLGVAYQSQGQIDLARKEYLQAVQLKPDYKEAKDNLDKLDNLSK